MRNKIYILNIKNEKTKEFKKRLYNFVLRLIECIDELPKDSVSRLIGNQLIRSGTSILGTYIEGLSASSKKDYINYFHHALKSTNESKVWVAILRDTKRLKVNDANWLLSELDQYARIFTSSLITLKGKKDI